MARDARVREHLLHAATEERTHLDWCEARLRELGERPSLLSPLWYAGSFAIGAAAGVAGDRWNLGFVEETERQVVEHLETHLEQLPAQDARSRAIVEAMKEDEARHGDQAAAAGARSLPPPVEALMRQVAKLMKFGACTAGSIFRPVGKRLRRSYGSVANDSHTRLSNRLADSISFTGKWMPSAASAVSAAASPSVASSRRLCSRS